MMSTFSLSPIVQQLIDEIEERSKAMENAVNFAEEMAASLEGPPDAADQLNAQLVSTREQWTNIARHVQQRLAMLSKAFALWQEFQGIL